MLLSLSAAATGRRNLKVEPLSLQKSGSSFISAIGLTLVTSFSRVIFAPRDVRHSIVASISFDTVFILIKLSSSAKAAQIKAL